MTEPSTTRRDFIKQAATSATAAALTAASYGKVLGANDRVRLGIIGPGARGQEIMASFAKAPNTEFVAAADVYTRRFDEIKRFGANIQSYGDHRKMLESKDVDAVLIASPLHCHARHFLDTLAAGKDMYAEKTMTWSIEEAEACLAAAKKNPKQVIGIGQQHNSAGYFMDARKWVKEGLVGKVTHVESWMSRNTPKGKGQWVRPIPADCNPQNVNWKAFLNGRTDRPFDANKFINWRLWWEFSGGNVTENMVHQIGWIIGVLDLGVPTSAYMSGGVFSEKDGREVPDTISVILDYPNDLTVAWQSTFSNSRFGLGVRVLGSDGTIEWLAGTTDMVSGKSASGWTYAPEKLNRPTGEFIKGDAKGDDHYANFVECVRSRKTPNTPVEIGYRSAIAAHMANLSYRRKEKVTMETARQSARK
ncbi:MAG TPA: Gfo/Idh/MocA family oxidoreductase [Blastocatellia bacterium]|nr:Gfo/Idh/MocA family oxidoreductase [Blastocatellia bacterium]HMX24052.1 Gfo/Idh/MocA family oxidoreductase [Blastocatellia bacterium]HMZ16921.1 Gfo/Idh/MocA family oxidoreductase [Blastocatellia bacterium]HNG29378.1 Gfo/Idh/MocA family oxidoreductase [Blastocatellia bacterium]